MQEYILAHDLGTSGNKATLYDLEGKLAASLTAPYETQTPQNGFVEQDPGEWWKAVCGSGKELMERAGIGGDQVACVTFSGQMMGCVLVDEEGRHLHPALIWADTRADGLMARVEDKVDSREAYRITGHRLSASYSAAKCCWIRDRRPEVYEKSFKLLNAKDYVICRLTGEFATDYSDASGTNLLDLEKKEWSGRMVDAYGLRMDLLPELYKSTHRIGGITKEAAAQTGLLEGTPVIMGGGDGSCAAAGAGEVEEGRMYNVLGSSSWISNAAKVPVFDGDMRTFNWVALDENLYTPCGTMQAAGYSFQWMMRTLCDYEKDFAEREGRKLPEYLNERAAARPAGANRLLFLPYLLGERSPRWNLDARGTFIGLGAIHTKDDMIRSVMEGVGYNLKVILDILERNLPAGELTLIGGGASSTVWAQMLADIWQKRILIPRYVEEATSMGAAVCAGVGIGAFPDFRVIHTLNPVERVIEPQPENYEVYEKMYHLFNEAYAALEPVYHQLNRI